MNLLNLFKKAANGSFTSFLSSGILMQVFFGLKYSHSFPTSSSAKTACGTYSPREGRITGGINTFQGEFPWVVSIKSISNGHFCGGFIVDDRHVISAAHCFFKTRNYNLDYDSDGKPKLASLVVSLGEFSLKSNENPTNAINASIETIVFHPHYSDLTLDNDIVLLRLQREIVWYPNLQPICLPEVGHAVDFDFDKESKVTVAGWGKNFDCQSDFDWKETADFMQRVDVPIVADDKCLKTYEDHYEFNKTDFLCAGLSGKDSAQGDSGGPLMFLSQKKWTVVGIVSAGPRCGDDLPGVYTKMSKHVQWVMSETQHQ